MERALNGVTFDISVSQPGTHVGTVAIHRIDPVIDHEERDGAARRPDRLRQFRIEVILGENIVPLVSHDATVRHACAGRVRRARESWNATAAM